MPPVARVPFRDIAHVVVRGGVGGRGSTAEQLLIRGGRARHVPDGG